MRHLKQGRKLGRNPSQRKALFFSQARALIKEDKITTTLPKAKELRRVIDKLITWAKKYDHWVADEQKKLKKGLNSQERKVSDIGRKIAKLIKKNDQLDNSLVIYRKEVGKLDLAVRRAQDKDKKVILENELSEIKAKISEVKVGRSAEKNENRQAILTLLEEKKLSEKALSAAREAALTSYSDDDRERLEKGIGKNVQVVRKLKSRLGDYCTTNVRHGKFNRRDEEFEDEVKVADYKREKMGEKRGSKQRFKVLVDEQGNEVMYEPILWKLIHDIGKRFEKRAGGYTRIYQLSKKRVGDNAQVAIIEFVEAGEPKRKEKKKASAKAKAPKVTASKKAVKTEEKEEPKAENKSETGDSTEAKTEE